MCAQKWKGSVKSASMQKVKLKRTLEMKQSDIEQETRKKSESNRKKNYKYNFYLVIEVPDHVYVLGLTYTCHVQNITDTHNTNMCDMYKSSLKHIHDPVLLSQDRNFTFFYCTTCQ